VVDAIAYRVEAPDRRPCPGSPWPGNVVSFTERLPSKHSKVPGAGHTGGITA